MGMTIHYTLKSKAQNECEVKEIIKSLHTAAQSILFHDVSDIAEMNGVECESGIRDEHKLLRFQASIKNDWDLEQPQQIIGFRVKVGGGCEDLNIALARHAEFGIWTFNGWCKTQYASNPSYGGLQNFLQCHMAVIDLLEKADQLGVVEFVRDEGGYWLHGQAESLADSLSEMNNLIAGEVGKLKDKGSDVVAPIMTFQNFEHLEANGILNSSGADD